MRKLNFTKKTTLAISVFCFTIASAQVHVGTGQPYVNIQDAAAAAKPGDTIYFHAGTYESGYQGMTEIHGSPSKWITITRYKNDPISITGFWQFMSCSYISFNRLNFVASSAHPGRFMTIDNQGDCAKQSHHIIIDSCNFLQQTDPKAVTAVKFGGVDTFQVTNCIFKDIVADAIDFNVCHSGWVKGNHIINNGSTAGHIKGGSSDIVMERNIFVNASVGGWVAWEFGGDTDAQYYCPNDKFEVKNLKFHSNIIISGGRGFALSSAVDCEVTNNTFYNTAGAMFRVLTVSTLFPDNKNNKVENNIFAFGKTAYINGSPQSSGAATFSNNIYYSLVQNSFSGPYWDSPDLDAVKEANPVTVGSGTAMFVDTVNKDLHLQPGSPAVAAGKPESLPVVDYYGNVFKSPRSIGAAEFNSVAAGIKKIKTDEPFFVCFPNPSNTGSALVTAYDAKLNASVTSIQVFSLNGELIKSHEVVQMPFNLNTADLAKGLYLLRINGKDFNTVQKLVVE